MTLQMSHTSPLRIGLMAAGALAAFAAPAIAQDAAAAPEFASAAETAFIFNTLLFLIGGFLVMWMAAGFAMLEAGLVRSKNVSMQCLKNIALYSIAGLMFWVIGYNADVHQRQRRLFRHAAAL
jgi:Amt family ammonium transporter